jgi:hypothetical protein
MGLIEVLYILIGVIMFQAYQIWRLEARIETILEIVVGIHLGEIEIERIDDDGN